MVFEARPWGGYEVLSDAPTHKVKRLTVEPGQRLSYQRHSHRSEHWFVVGGEGVVTLDGVERRVSAGDAIDDAPSVFARNRVGRRTSTAIPPSYKSDS